MMRSIRPRFLLLIALASVLGLLGTVVHAQDCSVDCSLRQRGCMREARTAMATCETHCRQGQAAATCIRACVGTFADAKSVCRHDLGGCLGSCDPGARSAAPQASGCQNACARTLAGCVHDVRRTDRQCVRACTDGPDHDACTATCSATANSGARQCRSALGPCLAGCGSSAPAH